ncbi:MAG: zinc-dependent peptidase [Bacteroidota bacterium]|nr:zinc-dependent peptidase [Bacteroidota bacterium]MDP4211458.1 zinc-dependent peptidase [Bacteroidota bacterium]MDP4249807.1 zinc-dependent peptidase [Bacteroidota bacterium]
MEIIIIVSLVVGVLILHRTLSELFNKFYVRRQQHKFIANETFYHSIVSKYIRFYNKLGLDDQRKFLFRTFLFKKARKFHYIEVTESPEMPILISAVAVQLTFGLDKFMLNYFNDIFVLKDDYHYGFYSRPFMGHVDQSGIYLSWDNFIKGISGLTPYCNMGLHEMGHALAYVTFITETEEDKHFKKEFKNFSKVARPIFTSMQEGNRNLLGEYAAVNYHEFWAVAVETFFENPVCLKQDLPELYEAMARLLKQDPLQTRNGKAIFLLKTVKAEAGNLN